MKMKDSAEGPSSPDDAKKREIQLAMIEILKRLIATLLARNALNLNAMASAGSAAEGEASTKSNLDSACEYCHGEEPRKEPMILGDQQSQQNSGDFDIAKDSFPIASGEFKFSSDVEDELDSESSSQSNLFISLLPKPTIFFRLSESEAQSTTYYNLSNGEIVFDTLGEIQNELIPIVVDGDYDFEQDEDPGYIDQGIEKIVELINSNADLWKEIANASTHSQYVSSLNKIADSLGFVGDILTIIVSVDNIAQKAVDEGPEAAVAEFLVIAADLSISLLATKTGVVVGGAAGGGVASAATAPLGGLITGLTYSFFVSDDVKDYARSKIRPLVDAAFEAARNSP